VNCLLQLENVRCYYGNICALQGVSMTVEDGEIVALIGSNGAGKTSTLRAISGLNHVKDGKITFMGLDITNKKPYDILKMGIGHVPEGRQVFPDLTVLDNLLMGGYTIKRKKQKNETLDSIYLRFPILKERSKQLAGTLSGGEQQMLAIGRTLMSRPKLMILDEPSMGLAPKLVLEVFEVIKSINAEKTTVLLVEQNAHISLSIADRAYILQNGEIVLSGSGKEIGSNEDVRRSYLGE